MPVSLYAHRRGAGKPLIILHGLFGSGDNWRTLGKRFAEHFDVHALDLRNHGRSPHADEMSYAAMADDIGAYIEAHGLHKTHIVGHSLGGKVAMATAILTPSLIDRLVIVDIAPRLYPPEHEDILAGLKALQPSNLPDRDEADRRLARHIRSQGVRQFLLQNLQRLEDGGYSWKMNLEGIDRWYDELRSWPPFEGRTFDGPTLLLAGTRSEYVGPSDRDAFTQVFPNSRFEQIDSGHWIHAEAPDAFFDSVRAFLDAA